MNDEDRKTKNEAIRKSLNETRLRHASMRPVVIELKLDLKCLNNAERSKLFLFFAECRWLCNYLIGLATDKFRAFSTKTRSIASLDKDKNTVARELTMPAKFIQAVYSSLKQDMKSLAAKRKKNGALKFRSSYDSIELNQYGNTHWICFGPSGNKHGKYMNTIHIAGIKRPIRVFGMEQIPADAEFANAKLVKRPPIVTIMGHVDHGKTSLLDYIRKTNVVKSEAGGITQHIGAYTIDLNGEKITFLDTPGHEAFTAMRRRGANVTDIAIIVIAADDGIMPQTVEAINHAKEAGVAIIVAANKIDKTDGNLDKLKQQMTNYDLLPEDWGGDVMVCPVSAKTGQGVQELLENVLLVAEVLDLKANKKCPATGSIIEARLDKGKGPVATVLVQNGTLKVSDYVVAGTAIGKIRDMTDYSGKRVKEAFPSYAVQVQGFSEVPNAGDIMVAVKDEKLAKKVAQERADKERSEMQARSNARSLDDMFRNVDSKDTKVLTLIVKADVQGSVEAVKQSLLKLNDEMKDDNVKINIIHGAVGAINESDVMLADTANAVIIAFNVKPEPKAATLAERSGIEIKQYSIIYDAIEDITRALKGMLEPTYKEVVIGHAEVRATFKISNVGTIAGSYVTDGKVARNSKVRLMRGKDIVYEGTLCSLKREKDDAKEVAAGYECGIGLEKFNDIKVGDIVESYILERVENE